MCIVFIVGLGVSAAFLGSFICYGPARTLEKSYDFSPNESRVLNYSSTWCSSVTVESTPSVGEKLLWWKESPMVSDHDSFNIIRHIEVLHNTIHYYKFHLYPGSHVNVTACAVVKGGIDIAIILAIRGESHFEKWQNSAYMDYSLVDSSFKVTDLCDNSSELHHLISKVSNEDDYYLVFYTPVREIMIEVSFQFYRTKLSISDSLDYCIITDGILCYLDISSKQNYSFVVSVDSPKWTNKDSEWLRSYSVTLKCHDRYSLYYNIGFILMAFCLLVACVAAQLFNINCHEISGRKYSKSSLYQTF